MRTYQRAFPYIFASLFAACGTPDDMHMHDTDTTAPTFAGATNALVANVGPGVTKGSVTLSWAAATDDQSAADKIVYLVYQAEASGAQNFAAPTLTSKAGVSSLPITDLELGKTYFYVIRAKDEAGNIDKNTVEVKAAIPAPPVKDTTAPKFAGLMTATPNGVKANLTWTAATDDITASAQIVYLLYIAEKSGTQNFAMPNATTQAGATNVEVSGLKASTEYFIVVRAKDEAGNIDTNTIEKNVKTGGPTFMKDVYPILMANCTGRCHGTGGAAGLDLSSSATAIMNLVSKASTQCAMDQRVIPNQPDKSYLIWKLDGMAPMGACYKGERMPKGGMLSAADMATVRAWIADGAQSN